MTMNLQTTLKSKYWLWFYRLALVLLGVYGFFYVIYGTYFGYQVCFVRRFPAIHDLDLVDQMEKRSLRTLDESPSNPKYERAKKLVVDLSVAQRQCVQRNGFDDCKEVFLGERTKKLSFTGSGRNGALGASRELRSPNRQGRAGYGLSRACLLDFLIQNSLLT